eukprot:gene19075-22840_t
MSAFEDLGVMPEIIQAVEELEWILPTAIQSEAIPLILGGGDVLAAAETGSGKTGAFALPILQITYETINNRASVPVPTEEEGASEKIETGVRWSLEDRDKDLAVDGLVCQARSADWAGGKASRGIATGKYYYEAVVQDEGLCRVGWSMARSSRAIGTDKYSWGYGGTGKKSHEGRFETYGLPFGLNDVIGCYLNLDDGVLGFTKNGQDFGAAYNIAVGGQKGIFYPSVLLKNAQMGFNFGDTPLKHQLKGYLPLAQADLVKEAKVEAAPQGSTGKGKNKTPEPSSRKPLSLIIEPVKELADQTYSAILNFSKYLTEPKIEPILCIGGNISSKKSAKDLSKDGDIIVGTPGILDKLIKEGSIDLSNIRFFVLDEADRLIQDNLPILNYIYNKLPKTGLQVLFFSATLHSPEVVKFSEQITKNPTWVDLKGKDFIPDLITHAYIKADGAVFEDMWRSTRVKVVTDAIHTHEIKSMDRIKSDEQKSQVIKLLKPWLLIETILKFKIDQALIFARTRIDCDNLCKFMTEMGGGSTALENQFSSVVLHGDKLNHVRKENLEKFKNGDCKFLICTDVASRGIDVAGLPFVINYTLPDTFEDYIHRVGRVGRADRMGLAISIVSPVQEKVWFHTCRHKGKGCFDTKLTNDGGCAIWYDEPELFKPIMEKLSPIEITETNFGAVAEELVKNAGKYSKDRPSVQPEYQAHTDVLRHRVIELSRLEETIQHDYLNLPKLLNSSSSSKK